MSVRILVGDALQLLQGMEANSVQCCVTSPPYYCLRDYGMAGQQGLEATPDAYVAGMVAVFREVKRVLRDDGVLFLNIGDSYASFRDGKATPDTARGDSTGTLVPKGSAKNRSASTFGGTGIKHKDLLGIPWMLAFALRADGWYLRSDIIWSKPNPMPESVTDRPTKAHEYVFLLTKNAKYFYDADAIAEPDADQMGKIWGASGTRNKRTVWEITPATFREAHFATMPPELAETCILAGSSAKGCCPECGAPWVRMTERTAMVIDRSERTHDKGRTRASGTMLSPPSSRTTGWWPNCDCEQAEEADGVFLERTEEPTDRWVYPPVPCTVLDPFSGAGTTGLVADRLGRNAVLLELNPKYAALAEQRIRNDSPLFAEVGA